MFVCAAAGAKVAKHGNRSVSSSSGSADVLEALGAAIELPPEAVARCLAETGFGFMFAPIHHPAMRHVAPVRRELGVRTIFNILGPLTNPAGAPNILMGVFHADLVGIQARVLQRLGATRALVVHGRDGLDEITLAGGTLVAELRDGRGHGDRRQRRPRQGPPPPDRRQRADRARLRRYRRQGPNVTILERTVNGEPGLVAQLDGATVTVFAFDIAGDRIKRIWAVRNPEKLRIWTTG